MFFESEDNKTKQNEKRLHELTMEFERLNKETSQFLKSLKVTPKQLTTFIEDKDKFSEKNWEMLQKERKKLEEKLDLELNNIKDPKQVEKKFNERCVAPHWIFCR